MRVYFTDIAAAPCTVLIIINLQKNIHLVTQSL
jgi:hypothetical protein